MLCPIPGLWHHAAGNSGDAPQHWLSKATLPCRRQHVLSKVSEQQRSLSGGQEVWQLPGGLSWNDTSRVVLRYISWLALHEYIIIIMCPRTRLSPSAQSRGLTQDHFLQTHFAWQLGDMLGSLLLHSSGIAIR